MRLQTKILLLLIPLVVGPLLTLGWVAYVQFDANNARKTTAQMDTLLEQFALHLETQLRTAIANVELFAADPVLQKYVLTTDPDERYGLLQQPVLSKFISYQDVFPDYFEIRIILPDGYEDLRWTRSVIPNITDNEADTPYFKEMIASRDDIYSAIIHNPDDEKCVLLVAKRLLLIDRSVAPVTATPVERAYLVISVDLEFMQQQLTDNRIGNNGLVFATGEQGNVLLHPELEEFDRLFESSETQAHKRGQLPAATFAVLKKHSGVEKMTYAALGGEHMSFMARQPLPGVYLFGMIPDAELQSASAKLAFAVATITLGAIAITVALLFASLKSLIIKPVEQLSTTAREIGRGNLYADTRITSNDEIGHLASSFREMGRNLREFNDQVSYLAYHDNLTGLPNRLMFKEYLDRALARAMRNEDRLGLLFLDLDDFKRVNDSLGHHVGDALLQSFAERLSRCIRQEDYMARADFDEPGDLVARLGGDEFIILLPHVDDSYEFSVVARRILESVQEPFHIQHHEFFVGVSIGITVFPEDGNSVDDLIRAGDIAMYHAKETGKNNYQFYSESMNAAMMDRLHLENHLRKALEKEEFYLHYQPLFACDGGQIVGIEALLRWHDPHLGDVAPDEFIPLAEETGLILPIGEWVLRKACRQAREWHEAGLPRVPVSVNISRIQLARHDLHELVRTTLEETGLSGSCLDLEITETVAMDLETDGGSVLQAVRKLGVTVSLDDFGTGYCSLGTLRDLPVDNVKIDRSFINEIRPDSSEAPIVSAIISMAHTLGLNVTAEGIEQEYQLRYLRDHDCDTVQGFLLGRPLPPEEISRLLRRKEKTCA